MTRLLQLWTALRASLWFIPSLVVLAHMGLAVGLLELDKGNHWELAEDWPFLFGAGPDGARAMLAAIAGSIINVLGVTFSITIVALSLASSQYSPRLLRNFMSDRFVQVVLGIFAGVFTYCLIVLRAIRGGDDGGFVPEVTVFAAFVLALLSVGFLVYFIHHVATSIQSTSIITSAATQTRQAVDRLYPQALEAGEEDEAPPVAPDQRLHWWPVPALTDGYLQNVGRGGLLTLACRLDTIIRMEQGIGGFVVRGQTLAWLAGEAPPDEKTVHKLHEYYSLSQTRTVDQDVSFGIRQIVDVALRALSPGINDTTTAVICLDYLSTILAQLVGRRMGQIRHYREERLRLISQEVSFEDLVDVSLNQIRQSAADNVTVIIRMLAVLQRVAALCPDPARRQVLLKHVRLIVEQADSIEFVHDRDKVAQFARAVREVLREREVGLDN